MYMDVAVADDVADGSREAVKIAKSLMETRFQWFQWRKNSGEE
jgi:hypothetical protein